MLAFPGGGWYAIAKIAGIKMCQAYRRQYGFNAISLMPTNLYGPGDNFNIETSHVLPALIRKFHLAKLAAGERREEIEADERRFGLLPPEVRESLAVSSSRVTRHASRVTDCRPLGTGTPRRELLHVDHLGDAALFLMERYDSEKIINVGVGEDVTIRELAEHVSAIVGYEGEISLDATKPDGTPRKLLDGSRLRTLGWHPSIPLRQGIAAVYRWYCEQAC